MLDVLRQVGYYAAGLAVILGGAAIFMAYLLGEWMFKVFEQEDEK